MDTIGKRIPSFRHSRGITQTSLATDINISQSLLSDIENDKVSPSWDIISKSAAILKIPVGVMTPSEGSNIFNNEANDLVNNITNQFGSSFDEERQVWQALVKSKDDTIATKDALIRYLEKK